MTIFVLTAVACSEQEGRETVRIADYGNSGADFARELALRYPRREAYSDQERMASVYIANRLTEMGYSPEIQEFTALDSEGNYKSSQNIIVRLNGNGFRYAPKTKETGDQTPDRRKDDLILIVGAHYDTPPVNLEPGEDGVTEPIVADGIHDNASGVAAVMTAARIMREVKPGYDVTFVLFGAGTASYTGAKHFLSSLKDEERSRIDAMVNVGPIFAGDKVYAHAGHNSVTGGEYKNYAKRRKLYQMTDIFFEYKLNTRNGYAIYTNQASFLAETTHGTRGIFREWTTKLSDHTPFDKAGIPVVFMESGEYRIKSASEVGLESKNPLFNSSNGVISGTQFDCTSTLEELFKDMEEQRARQTLPIDWENLEEETDASDDGSEQKRIPRLPLRINNTAFVIVQLARKGPLDYEFDGS
ncbi:MAG: M28 family metallopeptidase [Saccharofermentanales bacterium]|jgi:alkaline phosphatase isozyme conversion protein